jgi:hypothetical protein
MTRRFEQELQKLQWHHVLPIGPYGIQPFVQPGLGQAARAGWRLAAGIGSTLRQIVAFGRWTASGMTKRPMLEGGAPPPRHALRVPRAVRPARPAPQPLRRAA